MKLDQITIDSCLAKIRAAWPEVDVLPDQVFTMILNRIQAVLEAEGLDAITPDRILGWKEIAEDYLVPFAAAASTSSTPRG